MAETTKIAWTDATFNPWIGCSRVSPGCANCYAEALAPRFGVIWGNRGTRRIKAEDSWADPIRWNRAAEREGTRKRVFCASLADVFEDHPDLARPRARLFALIEQTPFLDWQLLTKRPENVRRFAPWGDIERQWPANVWLGTTAEDRRRLWERWAVLKSYHPRVRFLSCEPLLEGIGETDLPPDFHPDWVIIGGESGHGARPFDLEWGMNLIAACARRKIPAFMKQIGGRPILGGVPLADLPTNRWKPSGRKLTRNGADPADWPSELRVQEFPACP